MLQKACAAVVALSHMSELCTLAWLMLSSLHSFLATRSLAPEDISSRVGSTGLIIFYLFCGYGTCAFTCYVDTVRVLLPALLIRYVCFYLLCGYSTGAFTCFVDTVHVRLSALWIRYLTLSSFTCFMDTVLAFLPALWIRYVYFYLLCGYGTRAFTCFVDMACVLLLTLWIRYLVF